MNILTADELREWADYIDNPSLPRPRGYNPIVINGLYVSSRRLLDAFVADSIISPNMPVVVSVETNNVAITLLENDLLNATSVPTARNGN